MGGLHTSNTGVEEVAHHRYPVWTSNLERNTEIGVERLREREKHRDRGREVGWGGVPT